MKNDGIPKYPFYGYDNAEELDRDIDYMKSVFPQTVRVILKEVEDECDKMEYDGSIMFDSIPDVVSMGRIIDNVYDRVAQHNFEPLHVENLRYPYPAPCNGRNCPPPYPPPCRGRNCPPPYRPYPGPPIPDYDRDGNPDWMRNLVSVLLFNEMLHRRRRYRSRKHWVQ